jgi:hypothetical protein
VAFVAAVVSFLLVRERDFVTEEEEVGGVEPLAAAA